MDETSRQARHEGLMSLVSGLKADEERLLRKLDALGSPGPGEPFAVRHDPRWAAVARTHIEQAHMAINRAMFRPERIRLPEDD